MRGGGIGIAGKVKRGKGVVLTLHVNSAED